MKNFVKFFVGGIILFQLFAGSFSFISAQSFRGLIIDEYVFDLGVRNPGSKTTVSFTVTHDYQQQADGSERNINVQTRTADFIASETPGVPQFLEDGTLQTAESLADWITIEVPEFNLNRNGQEQLVQFTIDIPLEAEPGGKYAAILLANNDGDDLNVESGAAFGLNAELGPLVILTVAGDNSIDIDLDKMYTTGIRDRRNFFFIDTPIKIVSEFSNNGNVHGFPSGILYVGRPNQNLSEIKEKNIYRFNENRQLVLPDSTRAYSQIWGGDAGFVNRLVGDEEGNQTLSYEFQADSFFDWRIGFYEATLEFDYSNYSGERLSGEREVVRFFVLPWPILVIILAIILIIVYITLRSNKDNKKKKKSKK